MDNRRQILERFSQQADRFERRGSSVANRDWVRWGASLIELRPDRTALDVAGGTGLLGRAVAGGLQSVIVLDLTPAMLEMGRTAAASEGARNVSFMRGDAKRLPFRDSSLKIVMTRFSLHHIPHPEDVIAEMKRVAAAGGQIAVTDIISTDVPAVAAEHNRLERLRDPSHVRALTRRELEHLFTDAGLTILRSDARDLVAEVDEWLALTQPAADAVREIRSALEHELQGGPPTGMRPSMRDGRLMYVQSAVALVAQPSTK
ncbi:MAG TPA: methyltransferase domain-containing protein [Terriglobales bacterium]|nr:methyltransferase domain-containing protein [Terriglobales bacterium]